jgi:O-antigen ligase
LRGLYQVEGGYAAVAVEMGAIGLALWLAWSIAWVGRQWRCIRAARGRHAAASGFVLFGWMLSFLFVGFVVGLQVFQNFVTNAYFWLLSGVIFAIPFTVAGSSPAADEVASTDAAT